MLWWEKLGLGEQQNDGVLDSGVLQCTVFYATQAHSGNVVPWTCLETAKYVPGGQGRKYDLTVGGANNYKISFEHFFVGDINYTAELYY